MIKKLPKAKICTLFITYGCNLNCVYCFEKYKDPQKVMSLDLAKEIIMKEFSQVEASSVNDSLKIDLFGGEPLMNFKFIKDFSEWLWMQDIKIPYIIYATTNGTLLDKEKQEWFRKNKEEIVLVMSVDGDSAMQMKNRGCSTEKLPMEIAYELWPDQPFKMTISKYSIQDLANGLINMVKQGYLVESRLAQGENWEDGDAEVYRRELSKIARFYLDNPEYIPGSLFTRFYGDVLTSNTPLKFCGAGTNMIAYDIEGKTYPCHMFSPIVLGKDARDDISQINFYNPDELIEESCLKCKMVRVCPSCIGYNYYQRGSVKKRDKSMCKLMLVEAQVISAFQIEYYMRKKNVITEEEKVKLKAALYAYKSLIDFSFDNN
ncbi:MULTISPECIES: radical SAM protein [unclassified Parabacteroides]|uniref:radical SAM protein n=1 Tax=unclassified Parabacteroides TaxID=2649774 RepID=UPI0024750B35|nr:MULTISPECIES: radical SAM protein [unclassified Parabacteroides]